MAWTCTIVSKDPVQFIVYVEYTSDSGVSLQDQFLVPPNVLSTFITDCIVARLSALSARDTAFNAIDSANVIALDSTGAVQITAAPVQTKLGV